MFGGAVRKTHFRVGTRNTVGIVRNEGQALLKRLAVISRQRQICVSRMNLAKPCRKYMAVAKWPPETVCQFLEAFSLRLRVIVWPKVPELFVDLQERRESPDGVVK